MLDHITDSSITFPEPEWRRKLRRRKAPAHLSLKARASATNVDMARRGTYG
jgi:hypothetical protein